MLLTIDVGNTNTVLGLFDGEDLIKSWRVKTDPRSTSDEMSLQINALVSGYTVTGLSICSTVPATLRELRTMIASYYSDIATTIVEPGTKTGVPLLVDNPKEIGADRIVNTLAAHTLYGGPAIVVDFGTSTNLDVVSPKGEFLGGALAPGIEISVDALASRAAQLRKVELIRPKNAIGKNTVEALQSGTIFGFAGQVDGLVEKITAELNAHINDFTHTINPLTVHNLKFSLLEGRRHFVLHNFQLGTVTGDAAIRRFDAGGAADVAADRAVELESTSTRLGLGITKHNPDFLADLVGEDHDGARLGNDGSELAERSAHETGLGTHGGVADLTVEFLLRHEGGDGVEDDDVEGVGADEGLDNAERFFTGTGLGKEEVVEVDTQFPGILGVKGMLDIDKGGEAAHLLCLGNDGERQRGFTGGFGPEYFDDAAARESAGAEGPINDEVAGRDDFDIHAGVGAQPHDGGFAEIFLNLGNSQIEVLRSRFGDAVVVLVFVFVVALGRCHIVRGWGWGGGS